MKKHLITLMCSILVSSTLYGLTPTEEQVFQLCMQRSGVITRSQAQQQCLNYVERFNKCMRECPYYDQQGCYKGCTQK